jgi:hypothetical protein
MRGGWAGGPMSLTATLAILAAAALVFGWATYKGRQPYEPGRARYVPYLAIQFVAVLAIILMAGHLVTLLTGKPFTGRLG